MSFAVYSVLASVSILRRDAASWRVVNPPIRGVIQGLPTSAGRLIATDGLLCVIERHNQQPLLGHFASFVKDPSDSSKLPDFGKPKQARVKQLNLLVDSLL